MAVQKSKKSRAKRNMRRSHNSLAMPTLTTDKTTGELHIRHHITKSGYYKGKQVVQKKEPKQKNRETE